MQDYPADDRDALPARRGRARRQRGRDLRGRRRAAARRSPRSPTGPSGSRPRCTRLGIEPGDRVGTFAGTSRSTSRPTSRCRAWARCCTRSTSGSSRSSSTYVVNHAADRVVIVDDDLIPLLAKVAPELTTVERYVVIGDGDAAALAEAAPKRRDPALRGAPRAEQPGLRVARRRRARRGGDVLHERHDRQPEGRRLHAPLDVPALVRRTPACALGIDRARPHPADRPDVPRQRVGPARTRAGSSAPTSCMPARFLQAEPLARFIDAGAADVLGRGADDLGRRAALRGRESTPIDLSSFRHDHLRWLGRPAQPDGGVRGEARRAHRAGVGHDRDEPARRGRAPAEGRRARHDRGDGLARDAPGASSPASSCASSTTTGTPLPWDGDAVGEIEVRGPWITGSYYGDPSPEKFDDGWLRTGDVGARRRPDGYIQITDRAKDVIKSGGEWISSVELENQLMAHPDVVEARGRSGVPDERWGERPLACVVRGEGSDVERRRAARVPRRPASRAGRLPERWCVHRRGPEDERRQVRQEGAAGCATRPASSSSSTRPDVGGPEPGNSVDSGVPGGSDIRPQCGNRANSAPIAGPSLGSLLVRRGILLISASMGAGHDGAARELTQAPRSPRPRRHRRRLPEDDALQARARSPAGRTRSSSRRCRGATSSATRRSGRRAGRVGPGRAAHDRCLTERGAAIEPSCGHPARRRRLHLSDGVARARSDAQEEAGCGSRSRPTSPTSPSTRCGYTPASTCTSR